MSVSDIPTIEGAPFMWPEKKWVCDNCGEVNAPVGVCESCGSRDYLRQRIEATR